MISKGVLGTIAKDQLKDFLVLKDTVARSILPKLTSYRGTAAFVVKGVRRCGKSTLLKQMVKARFPGGFYYFNFDDDRIAGFKIGDFQTLMETLIELFGPKKNIFFDEIQNIPGWELFVNRLLREGYGVFITGSNANLLSKELGTHLTGRHVDIELYPFSFVEFLRACKIELPGRFYSTEEKALFSKKFKEYFTRGGMPEAVVLANDLMLAQLLNDIIQKDMLSRYSIRKPIELKAVIKFLIANSANLITYRSIKDNFGIKSANTVQKYVECAEGTYLVFTVRKFDRKIKQFDKNPKKIYCIDNGIIAKNTQPMNEKKGAMLENLVAIHLKRLGLEFYYYRGKTGTEADFVIPKEKTVIQVCYELTEGNMKRELRGLQDAMKQAKAAKGLVLTFDQGQEAAKESEVTIKPVWQWLLENELN